MNARAVSIIAFLVLTTLVACGGGGGVTSTITAVEINAVNPTISAGSSVVLSATVNGTGAFDNTLTWTIQSGGGTLSATSGLSVTFTAPTLSSTSVSVIKASSAQDASKFDSVNLTIGASNPNSSITGVSLGAVKLNLRASESTVLTATVTGAGVFNNAVTWSIETGGVGALSSITDTTFAKPEVGA